MKGLFCPTNKFDGCKFYKYKRKNYKDENKIIVTLKNEIKKVIIKPYL